MGKSLKNAVTPDEMYDGYGADTLRLYEMSMGPLDQSRPWDTPPSSASTACCSACGGCLVDEETGASRVVDEPARRRHAPAAAPHDRRGARTTWRGCASTPPSPSSSS